MPAPPTATADEIRSVNARYHDGAAAGYDAKWGIDYGEVGQGQGLGKVRKALGGRVPAFGRSLEIGAGTGYFSLNLLQARIVREAVCTDISPGMLQTLEANAARLRLTVETAACDAEDLPFADASFDLVLGHAVLHHLPDLRRAFGEFDRVLRPGGTVLFAGEPSRYGDRLGDGSKRAGGGRRHGAVRGRAITVRRPAGERSQARGGGRRAGVARGHARRPRAERARRRRR